MSLRFLVPRIIQALCKYYGISLSQLTPNYYFTVLSLTVLFKYFGIILSLGLFLRFFHIKKVGLGRFYIKMKTGH